MRRWLVMMSVGLVFSGKLFAAVDLPEKYRQWIDEEVKYIVSNDDRKHFLALKSDSERDAFIEEFWRGLDPYPVTPANEFRDEYYARLAYARDHFGLDSDQARVWVLLGKPKIISRCPGGSEGFFRDMICWYYWGLRIPGLPSYLQLGFFRRWNVGKYDLYRPYFDDPRDRIVSHLPSAADRGWIDHGAPVDAATEQRRAMERYAEQGDLPTIDEKAAQLLMERGSELVQESVKTSVKTMVALQGEETLPLDVHLAPVHVGGDEFDLEMGIQLQPEGMTFEEIGGKYAARIDLIVRVTDEREQVVTESNVSLPMELDRKQLEQSKSSSLYYRHEVPVISGKYTIDVIAIDFVSGRSGRVERTVVVDPQDAEPCPSPPEPPAGGGRILFEGVAMGGAERHSVLGQEYMNSGRADQAALEFERSIEDDPTDFQVQLSLARAREELGEYREAIDALDPVIWWEPWDLEALMLRSRALLGVGRKEDGRSTLEQILRQFPDSVTALNHCAGAYIEIGDESRARELLCRSLEIEPDQPEVKSAIERLRTE